jgi:histidinol-phosphate aminotransferase
MSAGALRLLKREKAPKTMTANIPCFIRPKKTVLSVGSWRSESNRHKMIRLDLNENTAEPALAGIDLPEHWINTYPDENVAVSAVAELFGSDRNQILLTNGSDEALQLIANTFVEPGLDSAIVSRPCFAPIPLYLQLAGARLIEIPVLANLEFDCEGIQEAAIRGAKLVMLASPDNPTGAVFPHDFLAGLCARFPKMLFIIDEAYYEYSEQTMFEFLSNFGNLIIVRSFSKAWALAGLRLGAILAHPNLIDYLSRVRPLFSVNAAAVQSCMTLVGRKNAVKLAAQETMRRKRLLVELLRAEGVAIIEGAGNSFLMAMGDRSAAYADELKQNSILVKSFCSPQDEDNRKNPLWGMMRVSVGTPLEIEQFLGVTKQFLGRN